METIKNFFYLTISLLTLFATWFIIDLIIHPEKNNNFEKVTLKFHNESHHIDLSNMEDPKEIITDCYGFICKISVKHFEVVKRKARKK
jgi:p-aminobenzoyl-glutamate transporter AbgT